MQSFTSSVKTDNTMNVIEQTDVIVCTYS